jgi:NitT/TauT family transport system substrate-binding protein
LPYFVALERGFFKEQNIEPETTRLMGGPPNVAAMMTNQIEVAAVLVTLEGLNADVKKPGVAMYIGMHSQTKVWKMEQFVVRNGFKAETIADLKGAKLMSAPGPANLNTAKAILAKNGLKEGDYTIDQLDMGQHVNAMTAGTFDGGYTLEPSASMMIKSGVARSLEAGVISKYILGDETANAYAAGCAMTSDFIQKRPDVARRFAAAWRKAIDFINASPEEARKYLAKNTFTPDNVVDTVPMLGYIMVGDMTPKQLGELQKFADFGNSIGVVPEKLDVTKVLQKY